MKNGISFKVPPPYDTPYTFLIGEIFKISGGQIHEIEANGTVVPYGASSGWNDQNRENIHNQYQT